MKKLWLHNIPVIPIPLYVWNSFPVFIKIIFIITVVAMLGILLAMAHIYIKRTARKREEKRKALIISTIHELLHATVVLEPTAEKSIVAKKDFDLSLLLSHGLSATKVKRTLVAELISYRNYFSGTIANRVRELYLNLSLHNDALSRLHKKNWEIRANALSELFKMDIEVDQNFLLPLLHDNNRYIREFARLSLMKFTKGDPLEFLHELNEPISQWQEFEIFLLFQEKNNYTLSSMEGLISIHKERSVVSLCLQLVIYFKQLDSVPLILELLETPDIKLRSQAICTLGKLEALNAEKQLIRIYPDQPHEIKLQILTALGRIRSGRNLDFLENEFISSADFEIKKYASDSIIKLSPLSKKTIEKLMENRETLNNRILNHSLNPLINAL